MAEMISSMKSALAQTPEGQEMESLSSRAALGGFIGVIAALLGLGAFLVTDLLPVGSALQLPFQGAQLLSNPLSYTLSTVFIALLAVSALIQTRGVQRLGKRLESGIPNLMYVAVIGAAFAAYTYATAFGVNIEAQSQIENFVASLAIAGPIFVISWQLTSYVYMDTTKSYIGILAGMGNALFLPITAISFVIPGFYGVGIVLAFILLLLGQIGVVLFWRAPGRHVREFARSSQVGKLAFGLTGFLTILIGSVAVFFGPSGFVGETAVWFPWGTSVVNESAGTLVLDTPPWAVQALLSMMIVWIMLGPRLGSRELKETAVRSDIVSGGEKYFMVILAIFGVWAASQASTLMDLGAGYTIFLTVCPAGVLFLMGALYMGANDVITGLPLVVAAIFLLTSPHSLLFMVTVPWLLALLIQGLLAVETKVRGHTAFSQTLLTVIVTIVASVTFILFMLGGFGSGPAAIWPANRWFNVSLFPETSIAAQAPTILSLVVLTLLVRNVALGGYSYGQEFSSGGVLRGISTLFGLLLVIIAGNADVTHQALTAAAIIFALYAISFVLVLSLNLNLGSRILVEGHELEGNFVRVSAAVGLVIGGGVALLAFVVFSGFPPASMVANVITILITLIVSLEICLELAWLSAGIRLGFLTGGFKYTKPTDLVE
ncbi:hypothetical protein EU538_00665 [Candidatus Thorarchaeota archaeon]|nr:MAG: hypothetical protein EU538_00665 [Candidatus Thorarchaeota archaeon]